MAKFKNENGEEFEAFTQEELDAKAKEASEAAAAKAVEDYKAANPAAPTVEEKAAADAAAVAANEPVAKLTATVEALQASLRTRDIADMARSYAGADAAKQAEFTTAFGRLTGYESTPDGMKEQAEAAAKIAGIDVAGVDISGLAGTGGGRDVDGKGTKAPTEADKIVRNALNISEADAKKYGPEAAAAEENKK